MNRADLVSVLKETLDDYKLSRGEKNVVKDLLTKNRFEANDLSVLRSEAFEIAKLELLSPDAKEVLQWLEDVVKILIQPKQKERIESEAIFSTQDDCAQYLSGLISSSKTSIDVCVFTITDDRITSSILEAFKRKVKIRVITDDEKSQDKGSDIYRLKQEGVSVKTDRDPNHMHHKFAIFDNDRLLNGSYNWTRSASLRNEENFVLTNDPKLTREFSNHFERLWHLFD